MSAAAFFAALPGGVDSPLVTQLANVVGQVEEELHRQVGSEIPLVASVGRLTLEAGGKRIRPALAALSAAATQRPVDPSRLARIGACLEMIHMATLIHDDVIDEAATRRGKPTAASVHGNTASILSGDVLLAKAMCILAQDGDLHLIRIVSQAVVELAEGEVKEIDARGKFDLSMEEHLAVLRMKTAAFIECCCRAGAQVAHASPEETEAVAKYGHHLGMAFQIADDLLDFRGDSAKTGKPLATDFREAQATMPLLALIPDLTESEVAFVRGKFGNGVTDADLDMITGWMAERGAFTHTEEAAWTEARLAKQALEPLPPSPERDLLAALADFACGRES